MTRECRKCGNITEDKRLVACPECHVVFSESNVEGLTLTAEQKEELFNELRHRYKMRVFGHLSILGVIGLLGLCGIYKGAMMRVEPIIVDRVVGEFETERIRSTVRQVAEEQASKIIEEELDPSILRFEKQVSLYLAEAQTEATAVKNEIEKIRDAVAPPKLILKRKEISKTESGHTALLVFSRSKDGYLGIVSFVAEMMGDRSSRIVDLRPANAVYSTWEDGKKIYDDGRAARLSFQITGVGNPIVELETSGPCTVLFNGSHDLETLFLKIP